MMLTIIYRIIVVYLTILIILDIWDEADCWKQFTGAMVIIPLILILRILMIK